MVSSLVMTYIRARDKQFYVLILFPGYPPCSIAVCNLSCRFLIVSTALAEMKLFCPGLVTIRSCHESTWTKRRLELHSLASSECENHLIKVWILRLLGDRSHLNHK
jgi:hypothetical protein